MKNILIPTDFSVNAGDALDYALALIGEAETKIHIVHAVDPSRPPADTYRENTDIVEKRVQAALVSMEALEAFSDLYFKEHQKQVSISTNVVIGNAGHSIKLEAKAIEATLIVMGTQGVNHSYMDKVLGTISTVVLRNAPCPVILVPRDYEYKPIDTVLFTTNLNHSDPYELWRAVNLIKPHIGVVRCLHIVKNEKDKNDKHLEEFAKYMEEHSPSIQTIFNVEVSKNIEQTILKYVEKFDAELIIMHKTKEPFWGRLFSPSHTKTMTSLIKVPMLVMIG